MKVIASSLRKGNVVEMDGRLYAVLKAENFHPGKGVPTTSVDMRYEQITVSADVIGDDKVFLTEGIRVHLRTYEGAAIAMELPLRVTVEITETEPVTKGQTASSSYKPAICSNGLRVMVPPHIGAGTRIVINTEDNSYQGRDKE